MTTELYNQEWLDERLQHWQGLLRLGDWKATVQMVPQSDLDDGVAGHCAFDEGQKVALIRLMRPEDLPNLRSLAFSYDVEHTLVHELLHLHLLDAEFEQQKNEEFAINAIADALLSLAA